MVRRIRTPATDRLGDVVGGTTAVVAVIAMQASLFGGDDQPLRFLLAPFSGPFALAPLIASTAFYASVLFVVIACVRATRGGAWSLLRTASADAVGPVTTTSAAVRVLEDFRDPRGRSAPLSERAFLAALPGAVARRSLGVAAIVAVANALFMIEFVIAVIPVFLVIFAIAAALIGAVYIVLRVREPARER